MKLFNKSKLSDSVLEPLLIAAGRRVGARTSGVVVKVTQGQNGGVSGLAQSAAFVYGWHLWRGGGHRRIKTDGGWYRITVPWSRPGWDSLAVAESFFKIAMHEWKHIADYQDGGRWAMPWSSRGLSGRRQLHDRRPEELRAQDAVDDAIARGALTRHQELIIALAIEHER